MITPPRAPAPPAVPAPAAARRGPRGLPRRRDGRGAARGRAVRGRRRGAARRPRRARRGRGAAVGGRPADLRGARRGAAPDRGHDHRRRQGHGDPAAGLGGRPGHGDAGVADGHRRHGRRGGPRLARRVPAAAQPGLGVAGAGARPRLRDPDVPRAPAHRARLGHDARHAGGADRAALGVPQRLRQVGVAGEQPGHRPRGGDRRDPGVRARGPGGRRAPRPRSRPGSRARRSSSPRPRPASPTSGAPPGRAATTAPG